MSVLALTLGLVVGVPIFAVLAYKLMFEAFGTDIWPLEILAVVVVAAVTAVALWWTFTGERVHEWLREGRSGATLVTLAVVLFASMSFTGVTILQGVSPPPRAGRQFVWFAALACSGSSTS